jgi:hypothetical protein
MRIKNIFLFIGFVALLMFSVAAAPALAGGGFEPPPPGATILGPEIWGVIVIYCGGNDLATVRVKRVVDCNVETDALVEPNWALGCPANASVLEGQSLLPGTTFFGLTDRTAFINKVKNFNNQGTVVSCDVQFKFWQ